VQLREASFVHIVAASVEALVPVPNGEMRRLTMIGSIILPIFAGNIISCTAVFAVFAYAQVIKEIQPLLSR